MKKIGIQTWGSNGDIKPNMALAEGLVKQGHHFLSPLKLAALQQINWRQKSSKPWKIMFILNKLKANQ